VNAADIRRLYTYTDWANDRLLGVIAGLSDEQFKREIVSSFSSVRETLAHIASAEWVWLHRWKGENPGLPEWEKASSFAALRDETHRVAADRRVFLADLRDDRVESKISYTSIKGDPFTMPLVDVLIHCANHSTYHRGQLVTMLRQLGVSPPNTDFTQFARS
jgi:uncharacterized damage-inducible protein DinB